MYTGDSIFGPVIIRTSDNGCAVVVSDGSNSVCNILNCVSEDLSGAKVWLRQDTLEKAQKEQD